MGTCCGCTTVKSNHSSKMPHVIEPKQFSLGLSQKNRSNYQSSSSIQSNSSEKTRISNSSFRFKNGDRYVGELIQNKPNGEGRFTSAKGVSYLGYWKNGNPNGMGTEIYPDHKGKFQGEYENGVKTGYGKITFEDGSIYEGSMINNDVEGYGILFWPDQKVYRGLWKANKMSGKGKMEWPNGMYYEGQYENDMKHGFGVLSWGKGKKRLYAGFWKNGKFHGKGMMRNEKGVEFQGLWNDGKLVMKCDERDYLDLNNICEEHGIKLFL